MDPFPALTDMLKCPHCDGPVEVAYWQPKPGLDLGDGTSRNPYNPTECEELLWRCGIDCGAIAPVYGTPVMPPGWVGRGTPGHLTGAELQARYDAHDRDEVRRATTAAIATELRSICAMVPTGVRRCDPGRAVCHPCSLADTLDHRARNRGAKTGTDGPPPHEKTEAPPAATDPQADPGSRCGGCGGPYRYDTVIPSPVWNRVVRAAGGSEYLCASCVLERFVTAGVSFTAELYGKPVNRQEGVPTITVQVGEVPIDDTEGDREFRLRSAVAALERFGHHSAGCASNPVGRWMHADDETCGCGLAAAIRLDRRELNPEDPDDVVVDNGRWRFHWVGPGWSLVQVFVGTRVAHTILEGAEAVRALMRQHNELRDEGRS